MHRYIFDAYGTLFDLTGALKPATNVLGDNAVQVLDHWRMMQLEYAWLSALGETYIDFETATQMAFQDALAKLEIIDPALTQLLLQSFKTVNPYPDTPTSLAALKSSNSQIAILSNGTPDMLRTATKNANIDASLDAVLSVDTVKTYKPSPKAYALGTKFFEVAANEVTFVSSNWWDVVGAQNFGYNTLWIDRGVAKWPTSHPHPKKKVSSLSELTA